MSDEPTHQEVAERLSAQNEIYEKGLNAITEILSRITTRGLELKIHGPRPIEVRRDPDGSVDEIVAKGKIHLEQMSSSHWMLVIYGEGEAIRVQFSSKAKIHCLAESERSTA